MMLPARGQVAEKSPVTLSPAVTRYVKVPAAEWIVLKNVRVIDGTGAPAIEKTDVVIHNGKIRFDWRRPRRLRRLRSCWI